MKKIDLAKDDIYAVREVLFGSSYQYFISDKHGMPCVVYIFPHGGGAPVAQPGFGKGAPLGISNWAFIQADAKVVNWQDGTEENEWRVSEIAELKSILLKDGRKVIVLE